MKKVAKAIAIAAAVTLTSSCGLYGDGATSPKEGSGGEGGVTVTYVVPASQTQLGNFDKVVKAWEEKTGNHVDIQAIGDQYESVVTTRLQSGTGIDIFRGKFAQFDVENQLRPIENTDFMERINPSLADSMKFGDKVYGVPVPTGINTMGVFYNKDAFAKAGISGEPKTLAELEAAMAKLKEAGVNPIFFSGAGGDGWTLLQDRNALYFAIGGEQPETWQKLNDNAIEWKSVDLFTDHYNAMAEWVAKGYVNSNVATANYSDAQTAVANGESGMLIQGDWVVGEMKKVNPDAKIGFFPLPTKDGPAPLGISSGDGGVHISKASKVGDAAEDFLRFMIEPENVKLALEATPAVSAFNDVSADDVLPDVLKQISDLVKNGPTTDKGESAYKVPAPETDLQGLYVELLTGRLDAASFAEKWQQEHVKSAKTAGLPGF